MIKKVLQAVLLLLFYAISGNAQEKCPFPSIAVKPFIAGYPGRDSLSLMEILGGGKVAINYEGFEVTAFNMAANGDCLTTGLFAEIHCNTNYISSSAATLLQRVKPGHKFILEHVHISNYTGQEYCLPSITMVIKNPVRPDSCVSLPDIAFIAGHRGAQKVKLSEILSAGKLSIDSARYEITGYSLWFHRPDIPGYSETAGEGAGFSAEMQRLMKRFAAGQRFGFNNIEVRDKAGKKYCLQSITLVLQAE